MKIEITDADLIAGTVKDSPAQRLVRAAAYLLLSTIGDMSEDETPLAPAASVPAATAKITGVNTAAASGAANTSTTTQAPPTGSGLASNAPPPPPPPAPTNTGDDDEGSTPPPPPANLGNVPPPPSSASAAGNNTQPSSVPTPPVPGATTSFVPAAQGAAPGNVTVELDDKGNIWDARIHQASKGKKKDGTWKLKKIFDSTPQKEAEFAALVEQVTRENAAKRTGSAPPVTLPTGGDSVPVPPQPGAVPPAPSGVPAPPPTGGSSVPVPPSSAAGGVGGSPYQALIDKIIALTKEGKISHTKVLEMCTHAGATSLQTLSASPHLIPLVDKNIDAAVLGLM